MGRPGGGRLHRRPGDRRDARPQRPAPGPLAGDQGRLGRARLRDRRHRRGARERPPQGPPAARQHLPRRPRAGPHRRGRRGQEGDRLAPALRRVVRAGDQPPGRPARARAGPRTGRAAALAPARLRLHAGGPQGPPGADRGQGRGADRLDGQRPLAGRPERQPSAALLLLQAAVRAGHEPADRPDPRGDRDERLDRRRLRAQPARRDAAARLAARDADADPAQPRAREAPSGGFERVPRPDARHHVAGGRRAGGHGRGARAPLRRGRPRARRGRQHPHPLRPGDRP